MNRGDFRYKIEIWGKRNKAGNSAELTDELGERLREEYKIGETFARLESRIGSLLRGRPADTVVEKTTMKISVLTKNINYKILPTEHFIKYKNIRYEIDYTLDVNLNGTVLEIFCHEKD